MFDIEQYNYWLQQMIKAILILTLSLLTSGVLLEFTPNIVGWIFKQNKPTLLLLGVVSEEFNIAKRLFQEYDTYNYEVLKLIWISDESPYYEKLGMMLGTNILPSPVILYTNDKKKYLFEDELDLSNLKNFLKNAGAGSMTRFFKSDPEPQNNNQIVKTIVGKTFQELVMKSSSQYLIIFVAPWCGFSQKALPKFTDLAKKLTNNNNIVFAKMDATKNQARDIVIKKFPTYIYWPSDKSKPYITYTGPYEAEDFLSFLKNQTSYQWIEPLTTTEDKPEGQL